MLPSSEGAMSQCWRCAPFSLGSRAPGILVVPVLVWLLAAAAPSQVRAACGDYVTVGHSRTDQPTGGMLPQNAADGYLTAYFGGQSQLSRLLAAGLASDSAEYHGAEYPRPLPG